MATTLLGRAAEQAAIEQLIGRARTGEGGGLVLRGEPGIGKSALLAYAAERASGARVLRAVGSEAESRLAYATLHQLLRPVLGFAERLPTPQARALGAAFGLEAGEPPDRFLVSMAALTLLSELAGERPVVCLVDDAHWADAASVEALGFVARRIAAEPIAVVVAVREGEGREIDTAGMEDLHLAGLDAAAASALIGDRWGPRVKPTVQDQLVRTTRGNPLALIELPGTLTASQLAGHDPLPEPLPLAENLERMFRERAARLLPEAQTLLLLAAAEGAGHLATVRRAAERLLLNPGLLESADIADLVRIDGPVMVFHHPLVRSAVYQGASPSARRTAHAALAQALEEDQAEADRRAWHRAQAAEGPDQDVARDLEGSAERTLRRSGHRAAAVALERAAELSPSDEDRCRRLVAAADASWRGGDTAHARVLLDRVERIGPREATVRLDVRLLRGSIELRTGVPADGLDILLPAVGEAVTVDPRRAFRMLLVAGEAAFQSNAPDASREISRLIGELPVSGDRLDTLLTRLLLSVDRAMHGEDPAAMRKSFDEVEQLDDPALLVRAGGMAWGLGQYALARQLRAKGVARARAQGAAGTLAWALEKHVADEFAQGHYALAEAYANEGRRLALEAGLQNTASLQLGWLVSLAALRGREEEARRLAEEALAEAAAHHLVGAEAAVRRALGELALAAGRPEEALEQLDALGASGAVHQGIALFAVPDLVEAAVRAGQAERGRERLNRFLLWTDATRSPEMQALGARSRALLAAADEAEALFQEALRLHVEDRTDHPFEQARTELLFGEFLRRERRRIDARAHLRAALESFERLGTPAWAERARGELRATGETARKRDPSTLDQLTPQELQIVRAVSEGSTNREIAAHLFISPRTVDYHLRKVFSKLGISSRTELIRLALEGGWLEEELAAKVGSSPARKN